MNYAPYKGMSMASWTTWPGTRTTFTVEIKSTARSLDHWRLWMQLYGPMPRKRRSHEIVSTLIARNGSLPFVGDVAVVRTF